MESRDDEDVRVDARLVIPRAELTYRFSGSGGPGGQHANTANTRAEVVFDIAASEALSEHQRSVLLRHLGPTVRVVASERRSQLQNRRLAERRLAERLAEALRPRRKRVATAPSRGSVERRLAAKRRRSEVKRDRGSRSGGDD